MTIRKLIERAMREVNQSWPITPKSTTIRYQRTVLNPRKKVAAGAAIGVGGIATAYNAATAPKTRKRQ